MFLSENVGLSRANHVGITVQSLDASVKFYEALTGKVAERRDTLSGRRMASSLGVDKLEVHYATVHLDNLNIDLLQFEAPAPERAIYENGDIGAMHLCFEVEDFQAMYARMEAAGIEFTGEPITFAEEDGLKNGIGTTVAYFDDPDGVHLEIISPKGPFRRVESETTASTDG